MVGRAWLLGLIFAVLIVVLWLRLFQLQVLQGHRYAQDVVDSRLMVERVAAKRGRILDRHGQPLVDNRAVYDLAVVISALELTGRERRAVPFRRYDTAALDALVGDLAARTAGDPGLLREIIVDEWQRFPGVGKRVGAERAPRPLGLLSLPRDALLPQGEDADPIDIGPLVQSGLLETDPRLALQAEASAIVGSPVLVVSPDELIAAARELGQRHRASFEPVTAIIEPFGPVVTVVDPDDAPRWQWHLFDQAQVAAAETALARFLGLSPRALQGQLDDTLRRVRRPNTQNDWFFVPAHRAEALAAVTPSGVPQIGLAVTGGPPARETIYLLQGDRPDRRLLPGDAPGLGTLLARRIAASIDLDPTTVAILIEQHGEALSARRADRAFRKHTVTFNPDRLARLGEGLSAHLGALGLGYNRLDLEERLAAARVLSDREWANQTRHDPLPLILDVPHALAVDLAGRGGAVPRVRDLGEDWRLTEAELPGLDVIVRVGRDYLHPGVASHSLGWLGRLSAEVSRDTALSMGLDPQGWTGRSGLESVYDTRLQGVIGRTLSLRTGTGSEVIEHRDPIAGRDLVTTLDLDLQIVAEDALAHWFELADALGTLGSGTRKAEFAAAREVGRNRGGLALMDVRSGEMLALASSPGFDLTDVRERWDELADPALHPERPLEDHATWAAHPPGSIVKPFVGLVAMAEGKVGPHEDIYCRGYMDMWRGRKILRDQYAPPGDYHMATALKRSVNVYFADIAQRVGEQRLSWWFQRIGFGTNRTADIAWARSGRLPTPHTLTRSWMTSDTWRMGIGQFMSTSPLQAVVIPAMVANGGYLVTPHVVPGVASPPEDLGFAPEHIAAVRRGMELVTSNESGATASFLRLEGPAAGIRVAAKTGTSQWGSTASRAAGLTPNHAWLIGYAPADNPEVAFAIFIYSGTSGGRACSGVAKRVLEHYFASRNRVPESP